MTVFVDTSAVFAVLDADDASHPQAAEAWRALLSTGTRLVTTNYVLVEATALVRSRLGMGALRDLVHVVRPLLAVIWIDEEAHAAGLDALLAANRRRLSLVDCCSFAAMRAHGVRRAFTIDRHFTEQGFDVVPAPAA